MPLTSSTDRRYKITTVDNGNYKILGNVSDSTGGAWRVQFAPDASFVGSLLVTARASGDDAVSDAVGFGTIAYRRVQLGGLASDYTLVTTTLTTDAIILVPANGLSVAIAVTCTAGFGYLYTIPLLGPLTL